MADPYYDLMIACYDLLDDVNRRYPEKVFNEWTCPHMARIARLLNYDLRKDFRLEDQDHG